MNGLENCSTISLLKELISRSNTGVKEKVNSDGTSLVTIVVKLDKDYHLIKSAIEDNKEE